MVIFSTQDENNDICYNSLTMLFLTSFSTTLYRKHSVDVYNNPFFSYLSLSYSLFFNITSPPKGIPQ